MSTISHYYTDTGDSTAEVGPWDTYDEARLGDGTRTVRDVADSVHCDTQPTTITTNNHPEEGQP